MNNENQDNQNESLDAVGATAPDMLANETLAKTDLSQDYRPTNEQNTNDYKPPTPNIKIPSSPFSLEQAKRSVGQVARRLKENEAKEVEGDDTELRLAVLEREARKFTFKELDESQIEKIGMALLENFGSVEMAAEQLRGDGMPKMTNRALKYFLEEYIELREYALLGHETIKEITDKQILTALKAGEAWAKTWVANQLYKGRAKGGYNPAEVGLYGYKDRRAKPIVKETANDVKGQVAPTVIFNFKAKDVNFLEANHVNEDIEKKTVIDAVDAEFEDVKIEGEAGEQE